MYRSEKSDMKTRHILLALHWLALCACRTDEGAGRVASMLDYTDGRPGSVVGRIYGPYYSFGNPDRVCWGF